MNRDDLPPADAPDRSDDRVADSLLAARFARDPGPAPQELAAARLLLRRALVRETQEASRTPASTTHDHSRPKLLPSFSRALPLLLQASGFALLIAFLVPTLPLVTPAAAVTVPDLATEIAAGVRSFGQKVGRWLPSLPPLDLDSALPVRGNLQRALEPFRDLGDELPEWWPALDSDSR
jgi:hypothetical protein